MVIKPGNFGIQAAQDRMRGTYDSHNVQIIEKDQKVDYLFIGDSITEMWNIHVYFGGSGFLVNRGVSGDITQDILRRWDADVTQLNPDQVILLAGTNDVERAIESEYNPYPVMTVEENKAWIVESVEGILKKCLENGIKIVLCTILPTDVPYLREPMVKNDLIQAADAEPTLRTRMCILYSLADGSSTQSTAPRTTFPDRSFQEERMTPIHRATLTLS
jgi:lysophospholipase L1-like esterase